MSNPTTDDVTELANELRFATRLGLIQPDSMARSILASGWRIKRDDRLRAKAWDEGFTKGFYDPLAGASRDACESAAVNPYERAS